jgi:membrane fusion protein, multidrug efflux system
VISVEIRPRISGYLDKITFQEGSIVEQGVLLFLIDPRPYQAALDQARGQLEQAQAQRCFTELKDELLIRSGSAQYV